MAIDLTTVISYQNSPHTTRTIEDVLKKAVTNIEVVVNVYENRKELYYKK